MKSFNKGFTLDDWSLGWNNIVSSISLDKRALLDCKNFNLTPKKSLKKRGGMIDLYGSSAGANAVKDLYEYKAPNENTYILTALDTLLRAFYGSQWNTLKDGLTSGKRFNFVTHLGYCFCANGVDENFKLYNTDVTGVGISPPESAPTVAVGSLTGLTGKFKYVYVYKRSTPQAFWGNPSPISSEIEVTDQSVKVSVVASTDPQIDKIVVYRTFDMLGEDADSTIFFKVVELENSTQDYDDNNQDEDLTTICDWDHDVPPKAKFIELHKDRVFYANCPNIENGESFFGWSKDGLPEAVPIASNRQYFDRRDGEPITGVASLGDYFIVFKRNKIGVLEGEFESFYVLSYGVGCIAPWAILRLEDKVVFLSEEGWKAFDGRNLYSISDNINALIKQKYVTIDEAENYSVAYYPEKKHFQFLINHSTLPPIIPVGHFLVPLMFIDRGIPEQTSENIVVWTYHKYDYHALTCFSTYTDLNGITRLIAGDNNGNVYQLDYGKNDNGNNIHCKMSSGWLSLGVPSSYVKTIGKQFVSFVTNDDGDIDFVIDVDFCSDIFKQTIIGGEGSFCGYTYCGYTYCGIGEGLFDSFRFDGTKSRDGQFFRYNMGNDNQQELEILSLLTHFKVKRIG